MSHIAIQITWDYENWLCHSCECQTWQWTREEDRTFRLFISLAHYFYMERFSIASLWYIDAHWIMRDSSTHSNYSSSKTMRPILLICLENSQHILYPCLGRNRNLYVRFRNSASIFGSCWIRIAPHITRSSRGTGTSHLTTYRWVLILLKDSENHSKKVSNLTSIDAPVFKMNFDTLGCCYNACAMFKKLIWVTLIKSDG